MSSPFVLLINIFIQKMQKWATLLTFSFITIKYEHFESIPHTPSCCCKDAIIHNMCINPQLKVVPQKFTTCRLNNVC